MKLSEIISKIDVWEDWRNNYKHYVPKFISEAINKPNWIDWEKEIFHEYFEKLSNQCVSSLQQGYFTNIEKQRIKDNWQSIAPSLKKIAQSQSIQLFEEYTKVREEIFKHTDSVKEAAVNRMIAGLQPDLLTTIVTYKNLNELYSLLKTTCNIEIAGYKYTNWFFDSNLIFKVFQQAVPSTNSYDLVTYPWQTLEFLSNNDINDVSMQFEKEQIVQLLKYKKQIILQGPPGTGKTKLAKEIAVIITGHDNSKKGFEGSLDKTKIKEVIKVGDIVKTKNDKDLQIVSLEDKTIIVKTNDSQEWSPSYEKIITSYNNQLFKDLGRTGGFTPYEDAIAKHLYEGFGSHPTNDNQVELIQFHPSFSYEDFVRGIVAKPNSNGDGILYEAENKIIGKFATKALVNYLDSNKDSGMLSKEHWTRNVFLEFAESISEKVDEENTYPLTENVDIIRVDENSFFYIGKNWSGNPHRMSFRDIIQAYLDGNKERPDLKKNNNLSGSAKQHSSYYVRILKLFINFINQKNYLDSKETNVLEKKYVLIIDEINRANLSSVLGELIYALEYRGEGLKSMYEVEGSDSLILPPNLYIIGTMNTADRSVGHIDYAIRRRFAFVDIEPKDLSSDTKIKFHKPLFDTVSSFFDHKTNLSREFDAKDVQLGHSYFIDKTSDGGSMDIRLKFEIKPLLREYVKDGILIGDSILRDIEKLYA